MRKQRERDGQKEGLGYNPLSGHPFVFRSRRGDRIKLLWWDRDGLTLYTGAWRKEPFASRRPMIRRRGASKCRRKNNRWSSRARQERSRPLLASCKRHGHDPWAYYRDILIRLPAMLPGASEEDLLALLPHRWHPA